MATLGTVAAGNTNAQFQQDFMVGNIFQATGGAGTINDLVARFVGATLSSNNQPFRPVIYNCSDGVTPTTLLAVGTEQTIIGLAAEQNYTFTGLTGSIVLNNYYLLGMWGGHLTTGTAFASAVYTAPGGTPGLYTAMTYASTGSPTSPWPTTGLHGTENKLYGALYIDYTAAGGAAAQSRMLLGVGA